MSFIYLILFVVCFVSALLFGPTFKVYSSLVLAVLFFILTPLAKEKIESETELISHTVENVDFVIGSNGQFVNLNCEMGKDIEEDSVIIEKKIVHLDIIFGISHGLPDIYKYEVKP